MPSGPGEIASSIDMSWQGASKGELKCHIESVYKFRHMMELNTTQFRFVAINTDQSCPGCYKQHEKNVVIELRGLTGEPTNILTVKKASEERKADAEGGADLMSVKHILPQMVLVG